MGLKQSIVVVNEFSVKTGTKRGTRGGSPGKYVMRYMARTGATEDLAPMRRMDTDAYIMRYMARKEATEQFDTIGRVKQGIRESKGYGGVAFGSTGRYDEGDISMSHHKVKSVSEDIQRHFDAGKTVMKTVISFDTNYLRQTGVIPETFEPENPGDFRGQVDQMKLRLGVMSGMRRMGQKFDDLEWVGVIQVDTMHVHCHLCMVDKGRGRSGPKGQQRGKLSSEDMRALRRGIDLSLEEMHPVKHLSAEVTYDRRNAKCYVAKFAHETIAAHGTPQLLMACLPEDRRLWRASTNRKEMRRANRIVREYVSQLLAQPDSGYDAALRDISRYAQERMSRESLTGEEYRRLIRQGKARLMDDCVNAVYGVLRRVPSSRVNVQTPVLNVMSMDYEELAISSLTDPMAEFGFKLRSYSSRLNHHRSERRRYINVLRDYREAEQNGRVSPDSKPLADFYQVELEYNTMVMAKYQHFLRFLPPSRDYQEEFEELLAYQQKIRRLSEMRADTGMSRRQPDSAEKYGLDVYGMHGGKYMVLNPNILARREERMLETYGEKALALQTKLTDYGLIFVADETSARIEKKVLYDFEEVKALDLHHLGYDFPREIKIAPENIEHFVEMSNRRVDAYNAAVEYLAKSGQGEYIKALPGDDIRLMADMAGKVFQTETLETKKPVPKGKTAGKTVSLDERVEDDIKLMVQSTVASMQFE